MQVRVFFCVALCVVMTLALLSASVDAIDKAKFRVRARLQTTNEQPDKHIMRLAFGIVGKTWQVNPTKNAKPAARGQNVATVLALYSGTTVEPFLWAVNSIFSANNSVHSERYALQVFRGKCEQFKVTVDVCKQLWKDNVVIYNTLQPSWHGAVELATFLGAPPKAVYYGALDRTSPSQESEKPKCDIVFPHASCRQAGSTECKMQVTPPVASEYLNPRQNEARVAAFKAYSLKANQVTTPIVGKAGFIHPQEVADSSTSFLSGDSLEYLSRESTKDRFNALGRESKFLPKLQQVRADAESGNFGTDKPLEDLFTQSCENYFETTLKGKPGQQVGGFCVETNSGSTQTFSASAVSSGPSAVHNELTKANAPCATSWKRVAHKDDCKALFR